jgi:hypothetical protein
MKSGRHQPGIVYWCLDKNHLESSRPKFWTAGEGLRKHLELEHGVILDREDTLEEFELPDPEDH